MTDLTAGLTALETREGHPEALRVLLAEYPRTGWTEHANFHGRVSFWLDRHLMFRRLMDPLRTGTEALVYGRSDTQRHAAFLSRQSGLFVNQLHGHHQIEDHHYFPVLAARDSRLASGLAILDRDHHSLDENLDRFVKDANAVLGQIRDPARLSDRAGRFRDDLAGLERFLDRHLQDEEDLIVPVILRHGPGGLG